MVISNTGFFPDGKWHGMAQALRTPGQGEELVDGLDRDGFAGMLRAVSPGLDDRSIDEYFKAYASAERRRGQLELYRCGEFSELEDYDLAAVGAPALILWGEDDPFAPVAGAHRFAERAARRASCRHRGRRATSSSTTSRSRAPPPSSSFLERACDDQAARDQSWLMDMDGVLVHEEEAIPGADRFLARAAGARRSRSSC